MGCWLSRSYKCQGILESLTLRDSKSAAGQLVPWDRAHWDRTKVVHSIAGSKCWGEGGSVLASGKRSCRILDLGG